MTKRQAFSRDFKIEAVRLLNEGTKKSADLARELGIKRNQLYKWKKTNKTPTLKNTKKSILSNLSALLSHITC